METKRCLGRLLSVVIPLLLLNRTPAAVYYGNNDTTAGGVVGQGSVSFTSDSTTLYGNFTKGPDLFGESLVFWIDSTAGGLHDTTSITDNGSYAVRCVSGRSGINPQNKSSVVFAGDFYADYAVVVNGYQNYGAVFRLNSDGSVQRLADVTTSPSSIDTASAYQFSVAWSNLGQPGTGDHSARFESTYITKQGALYFESFEQLTGTLSATPGYGTATFGTYDIFPVPEPIHLALAAFGAVAGSIGVVRWVRRRPA
jgi:hypothetical protein